MPAPDHVRRALLFGRPTIESPLRPPWALDEVAFLDRCTACGDCVARCPQRVLVSGPGGHPVFDPQLGECTFCTQCVQACEPAALSREARARPWDLSADAGASCLPRHGVVCSSCRDACPERAIAFPLRTGAALPVIDDARCTGCGACVSTCPVAAITLHRHPGERA